LARREYGERHPIVVQARITDAWSMIWNRDFAGGRRELERIDALIGVTRGAKSLEAAEWWLAWRSALEADASAADERLRAAQRAVELFGSIDARHPSLAVALANNGIEHIFREEFALARERYTQAAEAFRRGRQGDMGDLSLIELKLGQVHFALGDHAAAERAFAESYAISGGDSGGGAIPNWSVVAGYASFLHRRGERERARELFAGALRRLPATSTPVRREAVLQRAWGDVLLAEGRAQEALPLLQAAWDAAEQRAGAPDDTPRAALLLARAHAALGHADDARTLFRRALDEFARYAPGSMAEGGARVHWAAFLAQQGDAGAAQAEYQTVLDKAGARLFDAVPQAQLGLASLAQQRGELDAAWRWAEQARSSVERLTSGYDLRLQPQVWRTQARIALARGDRGAAADWAERALAASERYDGPDSPSVRAARELLALAR
jgi:serine/threonine-protein kinase